MTLGLRGKRALSLRKSVTLSLAGFAAVLAVAATGRAANTTTSASLFGGTPNRSHNSGTGVVVDNPTLPYSTSGGTTGVGGPFSESFVQGTMSNGTSASYADSQVDLTTGSLRSTTTTEGTFGGASTTESIADTIFFHVVGATADTVTPITITLRVTGNIDAAINFHSEYDYSLTRTAGSGSAGVSLRRLAIYDDMLGVSANDYSDWFPGTSPLGFSSSTLTIGTPEDFEFAGTMLLKGADSTYVLANSFSMNTAGGTDADFGHTAQFSFQLPDGVTFTSDSGFLLTAVPEPASCATLLGVLGLALLRRKRRS